MRSYFTISNNKHDHEVHNKNAPVITQHRSAKYNKSYMYKVSSVWLALPKNVKEIKKVKTCISRIKTDIDRKILGWHLTTVHSFPLISTTFLSTLGLYWLEISAPNIVNVFNLGWIYRLCISVDLKSPHQVKSKHRVKGKECISHRQITVTICNTKSF